jgi:Mg2+-importing ATPase
VSEEVLNLGLLCAAGDGSDPAASGNALDNALLEAGAPPPDYPLFDQLPFHHERRLTSTLLGTPQGGRLLVIKGAPESVLDRLRSIPPAAQATLEHQFAAGASVIAVASRPWHGADQCTQADERGLDLAGFLIFRDAPKADAAESLDQLKRIGVEVKLVNGDNPLVAETVCRSLRLDHGQTLTGPELEKLSDAELIERLPWTGIFARVSPEQKPRIIKAQRGSSDSPRCRPASSPSWVSWS